VNVKELTKEERDKRIAEMEKKSSNIGLSEESST